jgi:hypothetical protein
MTVTKDWHEFVTSWQQKNDDEGCVEMSQNIVTYTNANDDEDCGCNEDKKCFDIQSCSKTISRSFDVSVPVTITPSAVPERPDAKCAGNAEVTAGIRRCDRDNNSVSFTITQRINVDIPIKFGAEICYEPTCVRESGCGCPENDL